ncbi:MAG: 50S ribosomal protein L35 [Patescibacteria group bacterium]
MKTNKSFTKRLRITRRGKIVARKPGQNHFNAKEKRSKQMGQRRTQLLQLTKKVEQRYINFN